ncbi:acetyltransferase (GNAT) family protein [Bradyrhizobium sp. YR681]|uniref:GNAT family N-acetyltransferase n=1 Tax=Bradyrhizobium sp. YR681 TaxID=1144344 RepID=UPI00027139A4|nr:GNAT family N-acetyltransferase [Bradyrhizobium sp. YR681]EJN13410.1 acetyltransferase (GNAT) family protein [Bradyrhizobium sp. YR681]
MYSIRTVDTEDDEIAETLGDLHRLTFLNGASLPQFERGVWWLAYHNDAAVAFAGVVPSTHARNSGYFCRVGVLQRHWGRGLQRRLMRAIEARGRRVGWDSIVSDTTDNPASANNFIRAGYRLFEPEVPWAWAHTLYWRKRLR